MLHALVYTAFARRIVVRSIDEQKRSIGLKHFWIKSNIFWMLAFNIYCLKYQYLAFDINTIFPVNLHIYINNYRCHKAPVGYVKKLFFCLSYKKKKEMECY